MAAARVAVLAAVTVLDFIPGLLDGLLCDQCTMSLDDPRHNGVDIPPRYSWGPE